MKWLLALPILLASAPASAETVYLIIKSVGGPRNPALVSIPMKSMESCEEEGARISSSPRFQMKHADNDLYECVRGK
jgi:hypothetical protein